MTVYDYISVLRMWPKNNEERCKVERMVGKFSKNEVRLDVLVILEEKEGYY